MSFAIGDADAQRLGAAPPGQLRLGRARRRRGDVRAALLLLLAEEPRNGYGLIQAIETRSRGHWRPSSGSVYPTLAQLEGAGLIRSIERRGTRMFEITDVGRRHLHERHDAAPPWGQGDDEPPPVAELGREVKQLHVAATQVAHVGSDDQLRRAADTLAHARRSLYRILAEEETKAT
ncbi:MAG: helix-turn-helix transcriptional regulator [Solirubrobacterales bacterium]|nr:helix-turn-helix transcriptional regulator [Solirubrobacterales bacterium]MBV9918144.1 helix-turn-helix transcriptional regulator [Solirubrobacterales bacterium]